MKKTLILSFVLLCAAWAFAQTYPNQTTSPGSSQTSQTSTSGQNSSGNATTVEGCLNGSSGNYTLTDSSGKTWQLTGDTSKLNDHVGHKVEITGTTSPSSPESTNPSGSSGSSAQGTLNMTSMKHIASTCTPSH